MTRNFELEAALPRPQGQGAARSRCNSKVVRLGATALIFAGGSAGLLYQGVKVTNTLHPYPSSSDYSGIEVPEDEKGDACKAGAEIFCGGTLGMISAFSGCVSLMHLGEHSEN